MSVVSPDRTRRQTNEDALDNVLQRGAGSNFQIVISVSSSAPAEHGR
jgi:hypothetical protein